VTRACLPRLGEAPCGPQAPQTLPETTLLPHFVNKVTPKPRGPVAMVGAQRRLCARCSAGLPTPTSMETLRGAAALELQEPSPGEPPPSPPSSDPLPEELGLFQVLSWASEHPIPCPPRAKLASEAGALSSGCFAEGPLVLAELTLCHPCSQLDEGDGKGGIRRFQQRTRNAISFCKGVCFLCLFLKIQT